MKKKFDLRNVFLSIVSFLLVSCTLSCSFLFLDNIKHAEASPGSLTVQITNAVLPGEISSSARTLVPSLTTSAKSYVITCTQGGSEVASETLNTIASYTFNNLKPGTVTVTVNAYNHETARAAVNLIATGSKDVDLTPGSAANAHVLLLYEKTTGTGSIKYTIKWPETSADGIKWKFGSDVEYSAELTPTTAGTYTFERTGVASGAYPLIIQFLENNVVVGYAFEMVNVYANLESNSVVGTDGSLADKRVFTAEEIASTGTDVVALIVCGDDTAFINLNAGSLSGSYNGGTADSITVIPMVGESGQTISYTWKKGTDAVTLAALITAGTPISLTLATSTAQSSALNTLTLTVTAPNTTTTKTYTITMRSPLYVNTKAELTAAFTGADKLTNNVVLTGNITLSDPWAPVGSDGVPFTGSFNGGGKTITGLTVSSTDLKLGFFGYVTESARISNVRLVKVNISGGTTYYPGYSIGGLVGENHGGSITNCSVSGTVAGYSPVGGLVGTNCAGSTISNCYSTATVSATASSDSDYAGGLVGSNWGNITNCYARGAVSLSGTDSIDACGGLVGSMENNGDGTGGTVTNCYASNTVSTSATKGGLIGVLTSPATCISSYYNTNLCGLSDTGNGTPLTAAAIKTQSNFSGWNFSDTWAIDPDINSGYPYLQAIPPATIVITETSMSATAFQNLITNDLTANYKLVLNPGTTLTLTSALTPIGSASNPFTGSFDGNNQTITGLTVTNQANSGMFHTIGVGGVVKNLHLEAVSITGDANEKKGALAVTNKGTIFRCSTSGLVAGENNIGGLVGVNSGTISECWSNVSVYGTSSCGGLVGANGDVTDSRSGIIANCYARGSVITNSGGGLVGSNVLGSISNSYAAGPVTTDDVNGDRQAFVGKNEDEASITNCYFDETKIEGSYADDALMTSGFNGFHKNGIEMREHETFTLGGAANWDFAATTGVWAITRGINGGYPYLQNVEPTSDTKITSLTEITNLAGDYILKDSLTLNSFTPLGTFTGSFDGNGKTISNMKIQELIAGDPNLGMFETIAKAGFVRGVHFEDSDVLTRTRNTVGTLAGKNDGTVYECTSRGAVFGGDNTGGLIGLNNGLIQACSARGKVQGNNDVGGLVGLNKGSITESFAFSGVFGNQRAGGLVGTCESDSDPAIRNCYSRGVVSSPAIVGGFVGQASDGKIQDCYSATGVSLINSTPYANNKNAGAFVGKVLIAATDFTDCYYDTARCGLNSNGESAASISGIAGSSGIGNMAGTKWASVTNKNGGYPYLKKLEPLDDIIISSEAKLRGINDPKADYRLENHITLTDITPFATRFIDSTQPFTGTFDGKGFIIENISGGSDTSNVGMLFGYLGSSALVERLVLKNAVARDLTNQYIGLLSMNNEGTVYRCATSGLITAVAGGNNPIGGLFGSNNGVIVECYSVADVSGRLHVGGLVGISTGLFINSYAGGTVTSAREGGGQIKSGGFIGYFVSGEIFNSYSSGKVQFTDSSFDYGGFIGQNSGSLSSCFYDENACSGGRPNGTSKTTAEMKLISSFNSDWNIATPPTAANVWGIDTTTTINNGYPYLQWAGDKTMVP